MYRTLLTRSAVIAATALALAGCSAGPTAPVTSRQPSRGGNSQGGSIHRVPPGQKAPKLRTVTPAAGERQAMS